VLDGLAGAGGHVLATWRTHALTSSPGVSKVHVSLQRPGQSFAEPVTLGRFAAFPLETAIAPDGGGAVAWMAGSERRPEAVARALDPAGRWGPLRALTKTGEVLGLAAGPGGRTTVAFSTGAR
jgi:hypothetical protein